MSISVTPRGGAFTARGGWNAQTTYFQDDFVIWGTTEYQSILPVNKGYQPDVATWAWIPAASGGGGGGGGPSSAVVPANVVTTSYTFALTDVGQCVESTASAPVTFTIPNDATVTWPNGAVIEVYQSGTGQITIAGASGVTLQSHSGKVATAAPFATIGLRHRAANTWALSGDMG